MIKRKKLIFTVMFLLINLVTSCQTNTQEKEKMNGYKFTNKLINEKSPYLLQHAHNPVNWYPWGEEAFEKARRENKPIFLSIGYSTCHWCHVMEHESFEDTAVANLMNEVFVSIKVDREERPDIDNIYMTVCQMMTGHGGWPLTILMTPDKKPFYAGTYFPKESRFGRPGLIDLIKKVREAWKTQRIEINKSADQVTNYLEQTTITKPGDNLSAKILDDAFQNFSSRYDYKFGGFGNKPKFPSPHNLMFLLRYWNRSKNSKALTIVTKTLKEMRNGGMYDQIGFGFHRYSTDEKWLVPHFEKMLYDQALLSMAYTEAFQATHKPEFRTTASEIFEYVLRDMTSPEGGFYSAEDADSEGKEGKFYLWKSKEVDEILGKDANLFKDYFNIKEDGNFYDEATKTKSSENILHITSSDEEIAKKYNLSVKDLKEKINRNRAKLFEVREKRIHPHKDTKVLTDWNGLMIASLAKAGRVFNNSNLTNAAEKTYSFIKTKLQKPNGELLHRFRDGESKIAGILDDYAFLTWGLLELYESTFKVSYLKEAKNLMDLQIKHFWDNKAGGFFFTSDNSEKLLVRTKDIYDGAIPSGNSVSMLNLLRLSRLLANTEYENLASKMNKAFSSVIEKSPAAFAQFLIAEDFAQGPSYEVVVTGKKQSPEITKVLKVLNENFIPNKIIIFISEKNKNEINSMAAFTKDYELKNEPLIYVCKNYICNLPTTDLNKMLELLSAK